MNNQDQVPAIAELWGKLQFKSAQECDRESGAAIYPDKADNWRAFAQKARDEYAPIRQQLLERSQTEWGMQIREIISDGIPALRVIFDHGVLFLDSNDSKELGACIQFGSWELQQREKESSGD